MATQLDRVSPIALYQMKRQYGAALTIHKLLSAETDVITGVKTIDETVYQIPRAVIYPRGYSRRRLPRFALVNRKWIAGGDSDRDQREFLIDRKDTPGLVELTTSDWLVYRKHKYQVVKADVPEFESCFYVTGRDIGEPPTGASYTMSVGQHLDIDDKIEVE
jgi:hypothetical protein